MNSIISRKRQTTSEMINTGAQLLTEKQASAYLGVSLSSLRKGRSEGRHGKRTPMPRYVRVGGRVYYRRSDLECWSSELQTFSSLAEEGRDAI
jgi:predicted DNA-binding transcriptional regulator AlpA